MKNVGLIYGIEKELRLLENAWSKAADEERKTRKELNDCLYRMIEELGYEETKKHTGMSIKQLYNFKFEEDRSRQP